MRLCTTTGIIGNKKGYKEAVRLACKMGRYMINEIESKRSRP